MGFKKINGFWLVQNGSMTGTSVITSSGQNVQNYDNIGLEVTWTGTPTGTLVIQGSVSAGVKEATTVTYYDLTFNPALAQPSGSAGGYLINLSGLPYPYIRVKYTNASSTGTLNVYIFEKDLN